MRDIEIMLTNNMLDLAAFYGALHILIFLGLSIAVIRERLSRRIGLGDGGDMEFLQISRMQGHAAEYLAPILVLLLFFALLDIGALGLHLFGLATLAGRVMHAAGIHKTPYLSMGRTLGMVLLIAALGLGSLGLLFLSLFGS